MKPRNTHPATLIALALALAALTTTSCNLPTNEIKRIARKEAGKDDFRDSNKWGKVVTKEISDLDPFTHITLKGNADIKLTQGDTYKVEAYGNQLAIDANDIKTEDGTLEIAHKTNAPTLTPSIKILITTPNIESITVAGAGDIDLKGDINLPGNLAINISGAGDIDTDNLKCSTFSTNISGAGDMKITHLESATANIQVSGAGDINANIKSTNITVAISGAGDADLKVECDNIDVSASGTGEVELKGECTNLTKTSSGMASIDSRKLQTKKINLRK